MREAVCRLLLITGIPGVGKSTLLAALEDRGWRVLRADEHNTWSPTDRHAWDDLLSAAGSEFDALAAREPEGMAIEWGFRDNNLPIIERWLKARRDVWFLDGDPDAALVQWRTARPLDDEGLFRAQVAGLASVEPEIRRLFGDHRLVVLKAGPTPTPASEVLRQMAIERRELL